jgi:4-alpha-glucanotransferase
MSALHLLAREAGIEINWRDVSGIDHIVPDATLRAVLAAIGFAAETERQITESLATLRQETEHKTPPLVTATQGDPISLSGIPGPYRITLESGGILEGLAQRDANAVLLAPVQETGYHRLEVGDFTTTLAVAPRRAYTVEDAAAPATKIWGLTVQLYALRRKHDGGIGDFLALEEFVRHAAQHGADAIAISPVHAQFSADVHRFGPYAPSNRAALNILHIAEKSQAPFPPDTEPAPSQPDGDFFVDWPNAAAAKLRALRSEFEHFHDYAALAKFRAESGIGLERHAIFEALSNRLSEGNPAALNWRHWPEAYQNPENPAIAHFIRENPREIEFHAWAQYRADQGIAAAQQAARDAGAKIGLIADLAVGTDHSGSASWSRQDEVLKGLEIGAPPDLINREGQKWGITAFSPRGLRNSGFSAFIDMLRHALRHAGGVRIDHVMGLARLWVIPTGFASAQGAYITMPVDDLMRLVTLESQRHKAVILGEDLGTLPHGFGPKLNKAGIAGLRVMWFERDGQHFTAPQNWTPSAIAMTTTHDLPTVAGWWESRDIALREQLQMQGDNADERAAARHALWSAFQESGATAAPQPPETDGAAVTYAAAAHLGRAACTLALLPIEDALSLTEQPNLPGTQDEHPNWRRRLPGDAQTLFAREDFQARMAILATRNSK